MSNQKAALLGSNMDVVGIVEWTPSMGGSIKVVDIYNDKGIPQRTKTYQLSLDPKDLKLAEDVPKVVYDKPGLYAFQFFDRFKI